MAYRGYAEHTTVSVEKSRAEIERLLQRYGCDDFAYRNNRQMAQVAFRMNDRMVRFDLALPDVESFRATASGRRQRSDADTLKAWEQGCRQRWRALALVIKAKLEAVEAGITSFEVEFMAHMVVPGTGQVFHELALPRIATAYKIGRLPLPALLGSVHAAARAAHAQQPSQAL